MLHLGARGHYSRLREVLIVKIAAIGDVVMALPMLTWLHEHHPGVKITWVCGNLSAPLVAATGLVNTLLQIDDRVLFQGNVWEKSKEVVKIWKILFGKTFDLIVTAHPDPRYRLISVAAKSNQRRVYHPLPGRSRTEEYISLLSQELGKESEAVFPKLSCSLPKHMESIAGSSPVALAPGGAKNLLREDALRRWPIENYVEVAKHLIENNIPVVLIGASNDSWVRPYFASLSVLDCIGKTSLTELVAFLERCRLLVTHDTGPLHLAKLARCKTLALFGPTHPREFEVCGSYLWGGETLTCAPCYDGKNFAPCKNNLCMKKITPSLVLKEL